MYRYQRLKNASVFIFPEPVSTLSSAIMGGGYQRKIRTVVNRSLQTAEQIGENFAQWCHFIQRVRLEVFDSSALVLITAVPAEACQKTELESNGLCVSVFVTVGLGNGFSLSDQIWVPNQMKKMGTINLICIVNQKMTAGAKQEAMNLITSAKVATLMNFGLTSQKSKESIIGTPTDSTVLCTSRYGKKWRSVNNYNELGFLIMRAVALG